MIPRDDRAELALLLRRSGHHPKEVAARLEALERAASAYRHRSACRAASHRIGEVVSQLSALVDAARQAGRSGMASIPSEIFPETFAALVGRFPFSNLCLAPVTAEALRDPGRHAGLYRAAVIDATVEPHVLNAALRQLPDEPHLVVVRSTAFPFEAATKYFCEGLTEPKAENCRARLEEFIVKMSDVSLAFLEQVRDRVALATRDPERQNCGRRTLYDWAEPFPEPRLVWDVLEAILEPTAVRPNAPVQELIIRIVDLLVGATNKEGIRPDVISATLTIWVASNQHRIVAVRLSEMLDGAPGRAETPSRRRRRGFWIACHGAILDSAAELWRRACMGDHHHVGQIGSKPQPSDMKSASIARRVRNAPKGRATGLPMPTLDVAAAAAAVPPRQFLLRVAAACGRRPCSPKS